LPSAGTSFALPGRTLVTGPHCAGFLPIYLESRTGHAEVARVGRPKTDHAVAGCTSCGGPRDRKSSRCLRCKATSRRQLRARNPQGARDACRRWYVKNQARLREIGRKNYQANKRRRIDLATAWQRAHPKTNRTTKKDRCRSLFNRAVASGRIERAEFCSRCSAVGVIHGHHRHGERHRIAGGDGDGY